MSNNLNVLLLYVLATIVFGIGGGWVSYPLYKRVKTWISSKAYKRKFGIKERQLYEYVDVNGKSVGTVSRYAIYRKRFLFFKDYISLSEKNDNGRQKFYYQSKMFATRFNTKEEAENIINDMTNNPDKYITVK